MYVHNTKLTMYKYALREFGHGLSTWLLVTKVWWEKSWANLANFTKSPKSFTKILHFNYYYQYCTVFPNFAKLIFLHFSRQTFFSSLTKLLSYTVSFFIEDVCTWNTYVLHCCLSSAWLSCQLFAQDFCFHTYFPHFLLLRFHFSVSNDTFNNQQPGNQMHLSEHNKYIEITIYVLYIIVSDLLWHIPIVCMYI